MRLRELLPWRDFAIETSWSPDAAAGDLGQQIEKPRLLFFQGNAPFVTRFFALVGRPPGSTHGKSAIMADCRQSRAERT
jgi:hypothetical protein